MLPCEAVPDLEVTDGGPAPEDEASERRGVYVRFHVPEGDIHAVAAKLVGQAADDVREALSGVHELALAEPPKCKLCNETEGAAAVTLCWDCLATVADLGDMIDAFAHAHGLTREWHGFMQGWQARAGDGGKNAA